MSTVKNNVISIERASAKTRLENYSDDELMQLCAANVENAFAELVRRYQGKVRGFCRKWDSQRGDDLAQDVFVRLWRARHQYKPKNEFKAYLFAIVINQCRNAKRSLSRRPCTEKLQLKEICDRASSDQLDRILRREKVSRVHRQIEKLSPKLKEAVLLRFGQELSYRIMAEIIGANEATVRSRVLLGLEKLRKEL